MPDALDPRPRETWLGVRADLHRPSVAMLNLLPRGDLVEAAANLFATLRRLLDLFDPPASR